MSISAFIGVLVLGLLIGGGFTTWLLFGDRVSWSAPKPERIEDNFDKRPAHYTWICIGDAEVPLLKEGGTRGDSFARMLVKSASDKQLALAQIDDYIYRTRADYAWTPPVRAEARLRLSTIQVMGTAGFWFWNNGVPLWGEAADFRPLRWMGFQYISPTSVMDFTGETARYRAAVMNANWGGMLSMFGAPLMPKPFIVEKGLDGLQDWTQWHTYLIDWQSDRVRLAIDGETILEAKTRLRGPLALVLWMDNNWSTVSGSHFDIKSENVTTPQWLDIDYLNIERTTH